MTSRTVVQGNHANNSFTGTSGAELYLLKKGNDYVNAKEANDMILAGAGDDIVLGDKGDDVIFGGKGVDRLSGGNDNDRISGGQGNDFINGGWGDDVLRGGLGDDKFIFDTGSRGNDIIRDFGKGNDQLYIKGAAFGVASAADVIALATETNQGTTITLSADTSIFLKGVSLTDLDAGDFLIY
ncbi:MAG: calcium-binding protein [Beijerinckiaceae bacterium]